MASVGTRKTPGEMARFAMLKFRKNITGGCVLKRPCFCVDVKRNSMAVFASRSLRMAIFPRVPPGRPLFSAMNVRNLNRVLRYGLRRLKTPDADKYRSRGFRRGKSQELKEAGSPCPLVASSGLWGSPAFRGYVDLSGAVEDGVRNLFLCDSESESGHEPQEGGAIGHRMGIPLAGVAAFPMGIGDF